MKRLCAADAEPPMFFLEELIWEILSFLPVKTLIQFTCVCKSWKLIISNPQFVKLHLSRSSSSANPQLMFQSHTQEIETESESSFSRSYVSICSVPSLFSSQNQQVHLYPVEKRYRLIGVCNGLVSFIECYSCIFEKKVKCTRSVRLWNPTTRLWSLPSPVLSWFRYWDATFGFGYDCLNDIYKVVAVLDYRDLYDQVQVHEPEHKHREVKVYVYDMGGSDWRSIQSFPAFRVKPKENGVYVSYTLNWVGIINPSTFIIVSLDLGREDYSQLSLPYSQDAKLSSLPPSLGVLKDSLYLLHDNEFVFTVWQLKEFKVHESWTKLYNFCLREDLKWRIPCWNPTQFVLSDNHEVLLMADNKLILYNNRDNTFKSTSRDAQPLHYSFFERHLPHSWIVHNYIESLVPPYQN